MPHQERVVEESEELMVKIRKLHKFFDSEIYKKIDDDEQQRLLEQFEVMQKYWNILNERIKKF